MKVLHYAFAVTFVALAFAITTTWFGYDLQESREHGRALQRALLTSGEREMRLEAACRIPDAAMEQEIDHCHELLAVTDQCCQLCAKELL